MVMARLAAAMLQRNLLLLQRLRLPMSLGRVVTVQRLAMTSGGPRPWRPDDNGLCAASGTAIPAYHYRVNLVRASTGRLMLSWLVLWMWLAAKQIARAGSVCSSVLSEYRIFACVRPFFMP